MKTDGIRAKSIAILSIALVVCGLYLTSLYSYLLFHSLVELFSIVVAFGIFILAWNSRRFLDNNYLLFIGIAYLFIGGIDLIHTLGYPGMGVFQGYGTNLAAQLWIAARYIESLSLLIAFLFLNRKLKSNFVFVGYTVAISLLLVSIFYWNIFPQTFVEGVGLTLFKKVSEYIISLILMTSIVLLFKNRTQFDRGVLQLLAASITVTIGAELFFTFYISAYGLSNLVGHFLKLISFYLIYRALIETGLTKPFSLLFRNLKQSEEALQEAHGKLERRVEQRTAELARANEGLQIEITEHKEAEERVTHLYSVLRALRGINQLITRETDRERLIQRGCGLLVETRGYGLAWILLVDEDRNFVSATGAGAREKFSDLIEQMRRGEYPQCAREILTQEPSFIAYDDVGSQHKGCVLVDCHTGGGSFASRLEYDGKVYGTISVDVPSELALDKEEQELFQELVGDISYALASIEREEELKRAEEKVQQAEALKELDRLRTELLANVSHELRTPLASIKGFASTLLRSDVKWSGEEQRDFLQTIDREADRLTRIISDLLDMSRLEAGALKLEKGNHQISEILDSISKRLASLTKHHQLQVIVSAELPSVFVDEMRIGQVLTNLVENAAKYSPEGSEITIEAQLAGDQVVTSVIDRGVGIPAELLDRVFDRFYQTESVVAGRTSGTGLGLPICRGIIEVHGGRIWVESQLGKGSKFSFSLPVSQEEVEIAESSGH